MILSNYMDSNMRKALAAISRALLYLFLCGGLRQITFNSHNSHD